VKYQILIFMKRGFLFLIFVFLLMSASSGQEEKKTVSFNGYVTNMVTAMSDSLRGTISLNNLVHNRLNFKAWLGNKVSFVLEIRNRLYTGEMAGDNSGHSELAGSDPGLADMSWNLLSGKTYLLNSSVDRMWLDFSSGKFQARIGRQRINWGQAFVWNPNDIFNAYSFFDFDYVERPGSDAVRIQYYPSSSSAVELAVKADNENDITAAGLYRFNKWGYDFQILAGYSGSEDLVAGGGWSGALGSISFRGELSWFQPVRNFSDTAGRGLFTVGFDKVLKDNSMVQLQVMYCNDPVSLTGFSSLYSGSLSSKDLAFSRFSSFGQFTYAATPLLNVGISAMWMPDLHGWFAGPSVDYSLAENLGLSVLWQHFESSIGGKKTRINLGFLRVKYNF
jgi:hypothetical protein